MTRYRLRLTAALLAPLMLTTITGAQDADATADIADVEGVEFEREREWTIIARPTVWFPSLNGDVRFGAESSNSNLLLDAQLGLDDSEPSFNAESWWTYGRFNLHFDVFDFDTESTTALDGTITVNGTPISGGTVLVNDLGITSVAAHAGWDLFGNMLAKDSELDSDETANLRLLVMGGVRGIGVDYRLAATGGPTSSYDQWAAVGEVGGRLALQFDPEWELPGKWDVGVTALAGYGGYDDVDLNTVDVWFNITYMPTENIGVVFGYRQFDVDIDEDEPDFKLDSRLAGLYVGGTISF